MQFVRGSVNISTKYYLAKGGVRSLHIAPVRGASDSGERFPCVKDSSDFVFYIKER